MKAIVQDRYGAVSDLRLVEVDRPQVAPDEVLVQVRAASVHADVWHVVSGLPYVLRLMGSGLRRPKTPIPGTDFAGVIETIGAEVSDFRVGDAVFGESLRGMQWVNGGTYAEYVAAPVGGLALKPDNISFEEAAVVPTSGMIALANLLSVGLPQPGQRVLINGAGGGVGSIALQLAKAYGAHVSAVDHGAKFDMLRRLGADHLIDYTREDFTRSGDRYDLIFDVASNLRLADCKRVLTSEGKFVVIGHDHYGSGGRRMLGSLPQMFGLTARALFDDHLPPASFSPPHKGELMQTLTAHLAAGQITPVVEQTYPLSQTAQALQDLIEGRLLGRGVICP